MNIYLLGAILVGIFLIFEIFIHVFLKRKKKLPHSVQNQIREQLEHIPSLPENNQILEYDKLLDFCLKNKGYVGSLGEKMRQYGSMFQNEDAIWKAHKLRNKLAHEMNFHVKESEYRESVCAFQQEIRQFIS